jgi:catechol 2,3-dioxygenase-like lactoylglutathione lyase family enzyme
MADGLFPDLAFHHVGISVANLQAAIDFYGEVFGFTQEFRKHIAPIKTDLAFLRRGSLRLEFFQKAGSAPVPELRRLPNTDLQEQGTKHPCFSLKDCQAALEILHGRADVEIVGVVREVGEPMVFEDNPCLQPIDDRGQAQAFFFRDPNGILVEILRTDSF